jgi:type III restriction enzyme
MFLYEKLNTLREAGAFNDNLPDFISGGLNPSFELRPYQKDAFCNFINTFENEKLKKPQVLFHMATGSGKTLIMAGLILYLYRQGYRNFLFFVNLDNIKQKTKDNFLNSASRKYLFADEIIVDGERVKICEVENFQSVNSGCINICFTTTQKLHKDMWENKENAPTWDDFEERKTVLIADEAHHLNVSTRRGNSNTDDSERNWEFTVMKILRQNNDNILLEFTATCDLANQNIKNEYEEKIIFDYPLRKFREEKYSKDIKSIRADISYEDRALLALLFSQYRLKVFQENRIDIKPVVLFKAKTINESKAFFEQFEEMIRTLSAGTLERVVNAAPLLEVEQMMSFYQSKDVDFDELANELREEFNPGRCISVNDDKEATERQIILNSLEDKDNPYRAIFEVKKLDEGWDVLNLFDIVRLYETRDSKNGKPGSGTIAEAQLIGRGARYCPFLVDDEDNKYQRKYDRDIDNPLRVCEELYYHCQYNPRYFAELNTALRETGIVDDNVTEIKYKLKDEFRNDDLYKTGIVFFNSRNEVSRKGINELLPSIREKQYSVKVNTGKIAIDTFLEDKNSNSASETITLNITIGKIAEFSYSLINAVTRRIDALKFNNLLRYFPNLHSLREFITSRAYLGDIKISIETRESESRQYVYFVAALNVLTKVANEITAIKVNYEGSTEFTDKPVRDVFKDKPLRLTNVKHNGGEGISQNDPICSNINGEDMRINLADAEWFAFEDNYGTTEEKAFVSYFAKHIKDLKAEYDKVYLVRNERQLVLYSFDGGERFEPDYLLFLQKNKSIGYEQYQIFVEPKGSHLLTDDKWKEDFLLQIKARGIPSKTFADDNKYKIWGLPFFNKEHRMTEFDEAFTDVINNVNT